MGFFEAYFKVMAACLVISLAALLICNPVGIAVLVVIGIVWLANRKG